MKSNEELRRNTPAPSCCNDQNIQTFGPSENIQTPTRVCMNCGCLVDHQPDYTMKDLPFTYHFQQQIAAELFNGQQPLVRRGRK
jgi:hypothetical protein